ncbi:hypothetical protein T8K17_24115 [Thalassobaculum sp. OXR-137]|uniref:hypothetical protein n=1 Tax=Thalassobaculum sp. OXR-137 TaxID=3100173 RepID=UPI002AC9AD20|nr:hypothetical protein [Thalassobaculum sp. OXR-137]WPZ34304.1 hypothetical protein T8K17_24115 [Thalassobaculum sp. OXR-137]
MSTARTLVKIASLAVVLAGCANANSIYRGPEIGGEKVLLIDAKQRAITVGQRDGHKPVYCAEPSPDAFSVYSAAIGGGLSTPQQVSAALSAAFNETGSSIGLRTQTIQMLRDSMYRLCEAYNNGAMSGLALQRAHLQAQNTMMALLAVEQLTGYALPTVAQQGGKAAASAEASQKLNLVQELQDTTERLREEESELEEKVRLQEEEATKAEEERDAARDAAAAEGAGSAEQRRLAEAQSKVDQERERRNNARDKLEEKRSLISKLERSLDLAVKSTAEAESTFGTTAQSGNSNVDKDTAVAISTAVRDIVFQTLVSYDTIDRCLQVLEEQVPSQSSAAATCQEYLSTALSNAQRHQELIQMRNLDLQQEEMRLRMAASDRTAESAVVLAPSGSLPKNKELTVRPVIPMIPQEPAGIPPFIQTVPKGRF